MTNEQIITKWLEAKPYKNDKKSLKTDGQFIWSYELLIGRYGYSDDQVVVYNYKGGGDGIYVSHTTSQHIHSILEVCKGLGLETSIVRPDSDV